jgi:hypothetical protein
VKHSVEILYHFTCEECKNWWSIATEPPRSRYLVGKDGWRPKEMWCPHCGYKHKEIKQLDYVWFQQ